MRSHVLRVDLKAQGEGLWRRSSATECLLGVQTDAVATPGDQVCAKKYSLALLPRYSGPIDVYAGP